MLKQNQLASMDVCDHCGQGLPPGRTQYCCRGCQTVAALLEARGWQHFYRIKSLESGSPQPVEQTGGDFSFLTTDNYLASHVLVYEDRWELDWFLTGVHCAACLWLLERVVREHEGVLAFDCRLEDGLAHFVVTPGLDLRVLAESFAAVGYPPRIAEATEAGDGDRDLLRVGISGALAANVMLFSLPFYLGLKEAGISLAFGWLTAGLSSLLLLVAGKPFFVQAWRAACHRCFHFDQPISLGIASAYGLSMYQLLRGQYHLIYFDSMAMLMFFLLVGRYLRIMALRRARRASRRLLADMPRLARVWREGSWRWLAGEELLLGDRIRLLAGDVLLTDAELCSPSALLNLQVVSGEAEPIHVDQGGQLMAGTINMGSAIECQVTSKLVESSYARFNAWSNELKREQTSGFNSQRFPGMFLLAVSSLALLGVVLWWPVSPRFGLETALTVFIVACPCALALAGPTTQAFALRHAARAGIWIKSLQVFQRLPHIRQVMFDKTGVLTEGQGQLLEIRHVGDQPQWLEAALFALEGESHHPVAQAIRRGIAPCLALEEVAQVQLHPGLGISGMVAGRHLLVTNPERLDQFSITKDELARGQSLCAELPANSTHLCVLLNHKIAAVLAIHDPVRPEAETVVRELHRKGVSCSILSGDRKPVVYDLAKRIHADRAFGQQLPQDKLAMIKQQPVGTVAMVGDGLNDMGALAVADVGITHREGSAAALEFADVILERRDLRGITRLFKLVEKTERARRQGLWFSLAYNLVAILLALAGSIGPLIAAILMPLSSLTLVAMVSFHFRGNPWAS